MLPIVLVLFVATSAFAAPSVNVNLVPIQETSRAYDTGVAFNRGLADQLWELVDQGDISVNILPLTKIIEDISNFYDSYSQALAVSQLIAILGELSYGVSGNSCAAVNAIEEYVRSGAGQSYLSVQARNIDAIAAVAARSDSLRFSSSGSGSCSNARSYQFEAAWNGILDAASPYNIGYVNEEYCAAKRLYNAVYIRSNNVAAAITAASLPTVVKPLQRGLAQVITFLKAAASGNGYAYAASAKSAILS